MAEKVTDPEQRNTCEYFVLGGNLADQTSSKSKSLSALEELFKKK
jgi:hypothetical protein